MIRVSGNSHYACLVGMPVLPMAPARPNKFPALCFNEANGIADLWHLFPRHSGRGDGGAVVFEDGAEVAGGGARDYR